MQPLFFNLKRFAPGRPFCGPGQDGPGQAGDCFALEGGCCRALRRTRCAGCAFYKSRAQKQSSDLGSASRLGALDTEQQRYIKAKYYPEE